MTLARSAIFSVLGVVFAFANLALAATGADAKQPAGSELHPSYFERGTAGLVADRLQSARTSSNEIFDHAQLVAAHPVLEFGSMVRVTNTTTRESVDVRVVERSAPNTKSVIELSREAAREIGFTDSRSAQVTLTSTLVRRPAMAHRHAKPLRPTPDQPLIRLMPVSAEIALRQPRPTSAPAQPAPAKQKPEVVAEVPPPVPAKQKPEVVAEVPPPVPAKQKPVVVADVTPPAPAPAPAPKPKVDPKPVAKPAPPSEPESEPAAADGYRVQFGAFASQSNALQLIRDLQSKGIEARIVRRPGQTLNRVVSERAFPDPKNAGKWAGVLLASHGVEETVVTR